MGFKSGFVFVYMGSVNLYHLYVRDIYFCTLLPGFQFLKPLDSSQLNKNIVIFSYRI